MNNPKLQTITEHAANDLIALVADKETEILEAWHAAEEEAQLQETKPKFRLSLSITLDIDADKMETALTFASAAIGTAHDCDALRWTVAPGEGF